MHRMLFSLLIVLASTACGLADDPRDEDNKYIYITIPDPNFRAYCLREFDTDGNGRISRYEAQRVRRITCSDSDIESLAGIEEFKRLEWLYCRGNRLTWLDVQRCTLLRALDCAENELSRLDLGDLRSLSYLDCGDNLLERIDLQTPALTSLLCWGNRLTLLDVRACARTMERVDVRNNPSLTRLYVLRDQVRQLQYGPPTEIVEQ